MKNKNKSQAGFTLIEILIVMVIISILSVIGLSGFRSSQLKGRDSARKSDLGQIRSALEVYYNDKGQYPTSTTGLIDGCANGSSCSWGDEFVDENGTVYMVEIPADRSSGQNYYYLSTGSSYQLYAKLENVLDKDINENGIGEKLEYVGINCGTGNCNYGVSSPNTTPEEGRTLGVI